MQKIKMCWAVLTILTAALIFIVSPVWSAEVTRVHTNKGLVTINQGKEAGFTMGAEVCFYSDAGEKITCGHVRRTSVNTATVKVNNRTAKQINNGMTARLLPPTTHQKAD